MDASRLNEFSIVQQTVQHNCAISDARYSREYSLCIYLLRLREFYRWQNRIPLGARIDQKALADWVSDTEEHWDNIEETDYREISINGQTFDPFDADAISSKLEDSELMYTAGIGRLGQPHFLLAKKVSRKQTGQCTVVECGEELARDIMTLPAMAQGTTVYIRHQSFTHLLWQMFDEWNINKAPGPMARLAEYYNFGESDQLEKNIVSASDELSDLLLQHELGEIAAGNLLGTEYQEMTAAFHGKPGEMQIRSVRDLLADSLITWPWIAEKTSEFSIYLDFWLAGLIGYREIMFNLTKPDEALFASDERRRLEALNEMIESEQSRWQRVAEGLLQEYHARGTSLDIDKTIKHCIELSV